MGIGDHVQDFGWKHWVYVYIQMQIQLRRHEAEAKKLVHACLHAEA
jgi:hypothetical protein